MESTIEAEGNSPRALKAPKAPRWGPTLTEVEMKICAAGEYVAVTQARRSNL